MAEAEAVPYSAIFSKIKPEKSIKEDLPSPLYCLVFILFLRQKSRHFFTL